MQALSIHCASRISCARHAHHARAPTGSPGQLSLDSAKVALDALGAYYHIWKEPAYDVYAADPTGESIQMMGSWSSYPIGASGNAGDLCCRASCARALVRILSSRRALRPERIPTRTEGASTYSHVGTCSMSASKDEAGVVFA